MADEKERAAALERTAKLQFLERRVAELHAEGKEPVPAGLDLAEQIMHIRDNRGTYPGVEARRQAEREWPAERDRMREAGIL